jgi:hypothetical protein
MVENQEPSRLITRNFQGGVIDGLEDLRWQRQPLETRQRAGACEVVSASLEEGQELSIVEGGMPALGIEQVRVPHAAARRCDVRIAGEQVALALA